MADREKVIKAYEDFVNGYECFCTSDDYEYKMHKSVLDLLKEQKAQKFFVDESGKITPLPVVVRCKDCVNSGTSRCPCHYSGDPYIDWNPDDDWFCADGEAKT